MMVVALAMTLGASAQFEQGKYYLGASMTSFDASYSGLEEFKLGVDAKAGYFFMDNLMAYGQVGITDKRPFPITSRPVLVPATTLCRMVSSWVPAESIFTPAQAITTLCPALKLAMLSSSTAR